MNKIKAIFISKKELKKVMEQYKEFFTFCVQYGYIIESYDVSIVRDDDINNHSGVYYGERNELTTDYIRVEIIFKRSADFVSIRSAFKQETGHELPIPPDLNADQIIGFSAIRPDSKEKWHQHYKVYCMRFGVIRNDIMIMHRHIFENRWHEFKHWPLNKEPFKGCPKEMLSSAYNDAIKACAIELKYSIEYYNSSHSGDDWYVGYMKEHHPNDIPKLSSLASAHKGITLASYNVFSQESPEEAARRGENARKELERLKTLQSQKEDEERCAKQDTIGIINSWSLLEFAKTHGKMQVGEFANRETRELFKSCIFTKPDGTRTFVAFAAKMGELTPKQIAEMKNELQVVQLESGNYSLCKKATSDMEEVDLKEKKTYSIGMVVETKDFINGRGITVKSPKGRFAIMDVRIDESSWKVTKSYHSIIEGMKFVIEDIRTIEYDKEKDILKVIFNRVLKEGYDTIWFKRQYGKINITFYCQGEFVRSFDSDYDKAYTNLENLFSAFCALTGLKGDNAIVSLSGEAFQANYIQNYYDEKMIRNFTPLVGDDLVDILMKKGYTDDYYLKHYSMTREEYFRKNYNEVSGLTAKCVKNESWYPTHKKYPELELGKTYQVSHIGILRSSSWIILREFGDNEYNSACFELFENGESIEKGYTNDRRFWAPYLRERFHS